MTTKNIIDNVVDKVISKVDRRWTNLQKIRFVYLELGKYLEKNTDFFLNDKLESLKLTDREIMRIYEKDKINISNRTNGEEQYQVICKSAARFLKTAFDKLGISSTYIHTKGEHNTILHWFLVVKDGENQYFLTLAADLPYIKNEMPTLHFANHISYLSENGEETYVIPDNENLLLNKIIYTKDDGNKKETYEISHTELSKEQLKSIDESIGYGSLYEVGEKELSILPQLYMSFKESEHEIYNIFRSSFNIDETLYKRIDLIKESEVNEFKKNIYEYITNKLNIKLKIINNSESINFEERFKIYIINILDKLGIKNIDSNLTTIDLIKYYKKIISKNKEYTEITNIIKYLYEIINRFDTFINNVKESDDFIKNYKKYVDLENLKTYEEISRFIHNKLEEYKEKINKSKKELSILNLNHLLNMLTSYFIKDEIITKEKEYISLDYIVNKFCYMFPIMFEWNYNQSAYTQCTKFSIQNYSEQIVIIKVMLKILFPELTEKNCGKMEGYESKYSPVENRIQTYPLKNKKTKEYCIGFSFKGLEEENEVQFIYIPSENLLRESDPLQDRIKYQIVSRRFNERLTEIENINKPKIYEKKI